MASVVLTMAGGAIGGPFGAALGGVLGGVFDREVLFKAKGREGPRLNELRVQTSSYGTQIPRLFGAMRVAGTVIWATDLIEHRSREGGKGQPTTTSYSYTASFAVALSARPVLGVGRIWAEGSLLRGAAGDFKVTTGFRLHPGSEDQAPDPLIAAAEGIGRAPAHRGIAYAVFEDLPLADFGNRIPSLTFEVFADEGGCDPGAILAGIGEGALAAEGPMPALAGFSAYGASVRAVTETLSDALGGWFRADGNALTLCRGGGDAVAVEDAGAVRDSAGRSRGARSIAAADVAPRALSLAHYDPARDYQAGIQRAVRPGPGNSESRIELAAAIDASAAKTLAEAALAHAEQARERRTLALPWRALAIRPGARVTIADAPGQWRVARWTLERMVVSLECVGIAPELPDAAASAGRVLAAPDRTIGATQIAVFELPPIDAGAATVPRLAVAAAGSGAGWRGAALLLSVDGGASWSSAGATALPAVIGRIAVPPGAGCAALEDRMHALDVELANAAMVLGDADAAALCDGANLAMAGDELFQFARAEPLGGARWRLQGLWRGRRGTEAAIGTQAVGDRFVLLAADTLALLDLPSASIGRDAAILAKGVGDDSAGVSGGAPIRGIALVPPAPVHLMAERQPDGTTEVRWVRRSRTGWAWLDGVDAPLGEESERYLVEWRPVSGSTRSEEVFAPAATLSAADRTVSSTLSIRQIGANGLSPPAVLTLPPLGDFA